MIQAMIRGGKAVISILGGIVLTTSAEAVAPDSPGMPYEGIVARNVFNLHPPPPPMDPAAAIKQTPPPKITLTGITTILGKKMAFLTVPAKPGQQVESYMLAEGQAQGEIEVKEIDEKAGTVKVMNHGELQVLDFLNNGVKGPPPPPTGGVPNPMMMPPPPAPPPMGVMPSQPSASSIVRPIRSLPVRPAPMPTGGGAAMGTSSANQNSEEPLTPEQQVALIELQRIKYQQENDPTAKILPPTELTDEVNRTAPQ